MTDARQTPDPDEKVLLEHFWQYQGGAPSEHLDAFILATARREAPVPRPSLWRRWVRACQRPRWQVAFASLGGIALMLTVVMRSPHSTFEQAFAPVMAPSAPIMMERAPVDMQRSVPRALSAPAPVASMADQVESAVPQKKSAPRSVADTVKLSPRSAKALSELDKEVDEVLSLRKRGHTQEADAKWAELEKRYSSEELEAQVHVLQQR